MQGIGIGQRVQEELGIEPNKNITKEIQESKRDTSSWVFQNYKEGIPYGGGDSKGTGYDAAVEAAEKEMLNNTAGLDSIQVLPASKNLNEKNEKIYNNIYLVFIAYFL